MRAIGGAALVAALLLAGCAGPEDDLGVPEVSAASVGPDLGTNAAVCSFVAETPRQQLDTQLLWAQVNEGGAAMEEVLAIGWSPGSYNTKAEGDQIKSEQFYATLPLAREVVEARPGLDSVSVTFTGKMFELAFKTTYLLPASVVSAYVDTPEGRNDVQASVQVLDSTDELPALSGPNGLGITDADGNLSPQCEPS